MIPKQVKFQDAVGKTVAAVGIYKDSIGIRYTDGTFSYAERYSNWQDYVFSDLFYSYEKLLEDVTLAGNSVYFTAMHETLFRIGVLSKESILEELQPMLNKVQAEIEQGERKLYEQLKAKYGANDDNGGV